MPQVPKPQARGKPIAIETKRFAVRSLTARDVSGAFRIWVSNPTVMAALNMPARRLSQADLERFIASYDDKVRYLVGIFVRRTGEIIGAFMLDVTPAHALVKASGFIGDRNWWGKMVFEEVGTGLFDEFFKNRGIEKATAQVWEKNFAALVPLRRLGFQVEGFLRNEIRAFDGSGRRNQFILGLLAADWKPFDNDK
jgi:[ribosomal protein S5]-alanine N-acetyltransferase